MIATVILVTPLKPLPSTKNNILWTDDHDKALITLKDALTTAPVLSFYDGSKLTCLCTDTSRQGLGYILQQQSNGTT